MVRRILLGAGDRHRYGAVLEPCEYEQTQSLMHSKWSMRSRASTSPEFLAPYAPARASVCYVSTALAVDGTASTRARTSGTTKQNFGTYEQALCASGTTVSKVAKLAANEAKGIGLERGSFGFVCVRSFGPSDLASAR
jgi:hypothetical protein